MTYVNVCVRTHGKTHIIYIYMYVYLLNHTKQIWLL